MDEGVKRIIDETVALDARQRAEREAALREPGQVAGFWVRLAADLLDAGLLFVVGWMLSIPFRSLFERLGESGVFVGLAISMAYSGILHSRFGHGRTLGKRLLRLRVVRPDGTLLSLDRSLVRYALMALLVYQGAFAYAVAALLPFVTLATAQMVFGGMAVVLFLGCVLVVPFHPLKRGLHDLLAGTIVIRGAMPDPLFIAGQTYRRRDRQIVVGAAALAALAIAASALVSHRLASSTQVKTMVAMSKELQASGVSNVGINWNSTSWNGGPPIVTVMGSGFVPRPAGGGEPDWAMSEVQFALAVKELLPPDSGVDRIGTALRTGFNIGIYKSYETRIFIEDARSGQILQTEAVWSW